MTCLYQVGTLTAFLQGVNESRVTFSQLAQHGDIGLGTFNLVDGELIAIGGIFYRADEHSKIWVVTPETQTPFALVSKFQPVESFEIHNLHDLAQLSQVLDQHIPTKNIFYMIRIDGDFNHLQLRSESCQLKTGMPLSETLPALQTCFNLEKSTGTLVVTRCPQYSAEFTIPGYHYHYIDAGRTTGGHVFNLQVASAQVQINPIRNFQMQLLDSVAFDTANLEIDIMGALKKIE